MSRVSEIVTVALKLVNAKIEAETRALEFRFRQEAIQLRRSVMGICLWAALILISTALLLAGAGFLVAGIFIFIADGLGHGVSAVIVGGGIMLLSLLLFAVGRMLVR